MAREKTYQETGNLIGMGGYGSKTAVHQGVSPTSSLLTKKVKEKIAKGYTDCGCNNKWNSGIVLDPFMGSGTTAVVAKKLGRRWLGIELNEKYIEMANKRIENTGIQSEMKL
jgi:tRNA/tmRNA/rRNA uracil-C5-methylase (TrmA/RlmC/RlmD family)